MSFFTRAIALFFLLPVFLCGHFNLSICTIFKNEAPFLKEWIEFHKIQGCQHFYLYNNLSTDHFMEVLEPYILSQEVTLVNWPYTFHHSNHRQWLSIQMKAYSNCLATYGNDNTWIAFLDADEFLFCPSGQTLPDFLNGFMSYGSVGAYCALFGTSEIEEIPDKKCLIETLRKCNDPKSSLNQCFKSIVQPKCVSHTCNPHKFILKQPYIMVDADQQTMSTKGSCSSSMPKHDKLRINHYWTRTEGWFRNQKLPSLLERKRDHWITILPSLNEYEDSSIQQFVPELRKRLDLEVTVPVEVSV